MFREENLDTWGGSCRNIEKIRNDELRDVSPRQRILKQLNEGSMEKHRELMES
jgi:hypothetical protein